MKAKDAGLRIGTLLALLGLGWAAQGLDAQGLDAHAAGAEAVDAPLTYRHFEVEETDGRIVALRPIPERAPPRWARGVSPAPADWSRVPDPSMPHFATPIPFVVAPQDEGEPFHPHNHQPSIAWLANGDLLAIWYSTRDEAGPELTVLASRLRAGRETWDPASEFFKAPRRNMHGSSLFHDGHGTLYHFNGMGPADGRGWARLALLLRTSTDMGVTWTPPRAIGPEVKGRHQVISGTLRTRQGVLIQPCDAVPGGHGGTALHLSADGGRTWTDPGADKPAPVFAAGAKGQGTIAGIHAGVVELDDGRLLALGRGDPIDGRMPRSVSADGGRTWTYGASPFPPIGGGQRLVLLRLREGPILFASFTSGDRRQPRARGLGFTGDEGDSFAGHGLYAALSFDEGESWPVRRLLTPGAGDHDGGAWTGPFEAAPDQAEHGGYLAATQSPDGIIHLISSRLYYRFNLAWLKRDAAPAPPGAPRSAGRAPNIVFILADDLGWTDLGCQGSRYYETPSIDRLAAQGLRLLRYYNSQNCAPTRAALMTGQYAPRTGVYTVGSGERGAAADRRLDVPPNTTRLPLDRVLLPEALKAAGYVTGLFGKWQLGNADGHHPARRGFDEAIVSEGRHFAFRTDPPVEVPAGRYLADFLTDRALDFIERHRGRPFFLYLSHFAVHTPIEARPDHEAAWKKKPPRGTHWHPTYAAMIQSLDESVGRVCARIDELGLAAGTLVIFSSDNGGLGGYQRTEPPSEKKGYTDNAPLRGGKGTLYEGGLRVPFIARWPDRIPAGLTCDAPVAHVDLYPTLVEIGGGRLPAGQAFDGRSFLPLLENPKATPGREPIYWHFPGYLESYVHGRGWRTTPVGAIHAGDLKLLEFFETGRLELYDLRDDPGETRDLVDRLPDRARELHAQLVAWRARIGAPMPVPASR